MAIGFTLPARSTSRFTNMAMQAKEQAFQRWQRDARLVMVTPPDAVVPGYDGTPGPDGVKRDPLRGIGIPQACVDRIAESEWRFLHTRINPKNGRYYSAPAAAWAMANKYQWQAGVNGLLVNRCGEEWDAHLQSDELREALEELYYGTFPAITPPMAADALIEGFGLAELLRDSQMTPANQANSRATNEDTRRPERVVAPPQEGHERKLAQTADSILNQNAASESPAIAAVRAEMAKPGVSVDRLIELGRLLTALTQKPEARRPRKSRPRQIDGRTQDSLPSRELGPVEAAMAAEAQPTEAAPPPTIDGARPTPAQVAIEQLTRATGQMKDATALAPLDEAYGDAQEILDRARSTRAFAAAVHGDYLRDLQALYAQCKEALGQPA